MKSKMGDCETKKGDKSSGRLSSLSFLETNTWYHVKMTKIDDNTKIEFFYQNTNI